MLAKFSPSGVHVIELRDGNIVTAGIKRFRCAAVLFQRASLVRGAFQVEGHLEYRVKLYVHRIFFMVRGAELIPEWLNFVKGVIVLTKIIFDTYGGWAAPQVDRYAAYNNRQWVKSVVQ